MNLSELNGRFSTEEKCREFLKRLRWPNGVECPRCESKSISRLRQQKKFECSDCRYQFSETVGTIFHDSHLSLEKWFMAVLLICESRKGISANQMKRVLGVSYKTAWYLCHRIRAAMKERKPTKLKGVVEVDETYLGGYRPGHRKGRGTPGKEIVLGIRERGGDLRLLHIKDVTAKTLARAVKRNVGTSAEMVITDELHAYRKGLGPIYRRGHKRIKHKHTYVMGKVHTNTVENAFSLLKRGVIGSWHKISTKHLPAYLDEMTFRFNRRKNGDLFVDTLCHMVTVPVLTFQKLTA